MTIKEFQEAVSKIDHKHNMIGQYFYKLSEEVGELAKAIRKEKTNMCIDKSKIKNYDTVENEIADVFIVLSSICNTLNINLFNAFYEKEQINVERFWNNDNKNN